jgi:hypothetical protein
MLLAGLLALVPVLAAPALAQGNGQTPEPGVWDRWRAWNDTIWSPRPPAPVQQPAAQTPSAQIPPTQPPPVQAPSAQPPAAQAPAQPAPRAQDNRPDNRDESGLFARMRTATITGRQTCPTAPNGAPDCEKGAEMLCQANGFRTGSATEIEQVRDCTGDQLRDRFFGQRVECSGTYRVRRASCRGAS